MIGAPISMTRGIILDEAIAAAMWQASSPPKSFSESDEAIINSHNIVIHKLIQAADRQYKMVGDMLTKAETDLREARHTIQAKHLKIQQISETIRRQAEEIKRLKESK